MNGKKPPSTLTIVLLFLALVIWILLLLFFIGYWGHWEIEIGATAGAVSPAWGGPARLGAQGLLPGAL